jgi:hypothetical protein
MGDIENHFCIVEKLGSLGGKEKKWIVVVRCCLGEGCFLHKESSLVILHSSIVNSIFM